jgi:hypothetical protein
VFATAAPELAPDGAQLGAPLGVPEDAEAPAPLLLCSTEPDETPCEGEVAFWLQPPVIVATVAPIASHRRAATRECVAWCTRRKIMTHQISVGDFGRGRKATPR